MKIICPHCNISGKAADSLAGREVSCPKCGQRFIAADSDIAPGQRETVDERPAAAAADGGREERADSILVPVDQPDFTIADILREVWQFGRDRRFALVCRVGTVLVVIVTVVINRLIDGNNGPLIRLLRGMDLPPGALVACGVLLTIISMGVSSNAQAGLPYLSVRQSLGKRVGIKTCFRGFDARYFLSIFIAGVLKTVLIILGMLAIFPGIYLSVAYLFAMPLIIDRGLRSWQALELSRQAVTKAWFRVFGAYLILTGLPALISIILCSRLFAVVVPQLVQFKGAFSFSDIIAFLSANIYPFLLYGLPTILLWLFMLPYFWAIYGVLYDKLFILSKDARQEGIR